MKNFKPFSFLSLALVALMGAGCTTSAPEGSTGASDTASSPTDTATTTDVSVYADGTYSATGTYTSPAGKETVPVTLTLVEGVITDVSMVVTATNPASKQFQTIFSENFKVMVVGKSIDDVNLTKVSGSSLTPKGFNDAVAQIKAEAEQG